MKSADTGKWMLLGGAALGAAAMYAFDPDRGRQRRAYARDRTLSAATRTRDTLSAAGRDLSHRVSGAGAWARRIVRRDEHPGDRKLMERVRAELGHCVSNPHAIRTDVEHARVKLRGPVLASEEAKVMDRISNVPGVFEVINQLTIYDEPGNIPSLQSGRGSGRQREFAPQTWRPASRVAAGTAGGLLIMAGLGLRTPVLGVLASVLGAGLALRAISNRELKQIVRKGTSRRAIEVEKSIHIDASPETIFSLWENCENFPRFMSHVKEVRDLGGGRSHWIVEGPAGTPIEFDSKMTRREAPHVLAWATEPGASVPNEGMVRLQPDADGGTQVTVRMAYNPPGGALGQAFSALLGSDPKQRLDDDLMRMKAFIESGATPGSAAMPMSGMSQETPPPTLHS